MAVFLLCFSGLSSAVAATFTVTNTNDSGAGSLRQAIADANSNGEADTINFSTNGTITLTGGQMAIYQPLTINGNGITLDANHNSRFFELDRPSSDLTLSNMALINGKDNYRGGAIYLWVGNKLTLNNVHLSGNQLGNKGEGGGAIFALQSTVTINNSTFSNNLSEGFVGGGVIVLHSSRVTVNNSSFSVNRAKKIGGAISIIESIVTINNSTFSYNSTESFGGALYLSYGSQVAVNNSTFSGNKAKSGGAISSSVADTKLSINNSTLSGNQATDYAGAIYASEHEPTLHSNILLGNTASNHPSTNNCIFSDGAQIAPSSAHNLLDEGCGLSNGSNGNIVEGLYVGDVLEDLADNGCAIPAGFGASASCVKTMKLTEESPALDKGSNIGNLTTDQRGNGYPRTSNGQTDIGAYEPVSYTIGGKVIDFDETANGEPKGAITPIYLKVYADSGLHELSLEKNGAFTLGTPVDDGSGYSLAIRGDIDVIPKIGDAYDHQKCSITQGEYGDVNAANITNIRITCTYKKFAIGGDVSGLNGTVVLQNGSHSKTVSGNGTVNFAFDPVRNGDYTVTVKTHPAGQHCEVTSGGTGRLRGQDINSVKVTCSNKLYSIGGQVSGLNGTLKLKNGSETINVTSNSFTFATKVAHNGGYDVSIVGQPAGQHCDINHYSGTVNAAHVTNIQVKCSNKLYSIGGTVSDLNGTLKLKNGSETINVTTSSFTFANKVAHNGGYDVSIVGQPAGQKCTISHAKDTVNAANVTNIQVKCSSYKVGRIFADSFEK